MDRDLLNQEWEALEEGIKMLVGRVEALQLRCKELEQENKSLETSLRSCKDSLKGLQKQGEVRSIVAGWLVGQGRTDSKDEKRAEGKGEGEVPGHSYGVKREERVKILDKHIACLERCITFLKK